MNSATDRSSSDPAPSRPAPMTSRPSTGSSAITEVLIDRTRVWLTARFAAWVNVILLPPVMPTVFSRTLSNTTTVS